MLMITMSRMLSELLGAAEPMFTIALKQLEQASGNTSADVRLSAEVVGKARLATRSLGLDAHDSTGKELYFGLLDITRRHDRFLAAKLGAKDPENVQDVLSRLQQAAQHLNVPKHAWVLKHSVARRLLKATPPKKVLKFLGYRSVDSMLKRESVTELFAAIRLLESAEWVNGFLRKYSRLNPSDFEVRDVEVVLLDTKRWGKVSAGYFRENCHNVSHLKELGAVLILPIPLKKMSGLTLAGLPLLLHYINEIRLYSSYFKLRQVHPEFGNILVETLIADPGNHAVMAGQKVHWRVVQRHFGRSEARNHPELFEPHVQSEDLEWRKTEEVLYRLEPALHFWHDLDYVGVLDHGKPVSFNLLDMALNNLNGLEYSDRLHAHFRDSLWNEVFMRYMGQETLETAILKQLDNEMLEPERLLKGVV